MTRETQPIIPHHVDTLLITSNYFLCRYIIQKVKKSDSIPVQYRAIGQGKRLSGEQELAVGEGWRWREVRSGKMASEEHRMGGIEGLN